VKGETPMEKAFNIKEIAEITGKSHTTIYRYIKKGKIPFFTLQKDGQTVFQVKQQDLEGFLKCKLEDVKKDEIPHVKTILQDDKTVFQLTQESLQEAISHGISQAISQQQQQLTKPLEEMASFRCGVLENEVKHLQGEKETLRQENEILREQLKLLPDKEKELKDLEASHLQELENLRKQAEEDKLKLQELHEQDIEKIRAEQELEKQKIAAAWQEELKQAKRPWWKFW